MKEHHINEFDILSMKVMYHLLTISEEGEQILPIIDLLHEMKIAHFTLEEKNRVLNEKINIDTKTGLLKFDESYFLNISKTVSRVLLGHAGGVFQLSYIRLDIDDFSVFNNKYGHDLGDEVLVRVARVIRESTRPTDFCIRFGGEEFDVMLPSTDIKGAGYVIEKLFERIRAIEMPWRDEKLKVTVSAGLSMIKMPVEGLKEFDAKVFAEKYHNLMREADNALYDAKFMGKNRYCSYDDARREEYTQIRKKYVEVSGRG